MRPLSLAALAVALLAAARLPAARAAAEAAAAPEACNGIPGLCALPVGRVTWLGTHNSLAIFSELACPLRRNFANQAAPLLGQLDAGARVLNIDASLKQGQIMFGHGLCANGRSPPALAFRDLGNWLAAHPSETLILDFDDNSEKDNPAAAARMRRDLEGAMASSPLGPLLFKGRLTSDTRMSDVRGKAVVVFDAGQWGGGGDGPASTASRGTWLKAWGEASSGHLYAEAPSKAQITRDAVADELVARFLSDGWSPQDARCGKTVPMRSFAFGSGDWQCLPGADVGTCQLPLLANATNSYAHLASALRRTSEACGAPAGGVGPPGANVILLDFFPPVPAGAAASAPAAAITTSGEGALGPRRLVDDLNRAAVLGYRGCKWLGSGELSCPGFPPRTPANASVKGAAAAGAAAAAPKGAGGKEAAGLASAAAPAAGAPAGAQRAATSGAARPAAGLVAAALARALLGALGP